MSFKIGWLDEKLNIYEIILSDPYSPEDQDRFFEAFFSFMDSGPSPLYGLFDVSKWSESGATGLSDPRFRKMGNYRQKIVVIVMITNNRVTASLGKLGALVSGYRDWVHFEESREQGIIYLKERATAELSEAGKS
jgi:hypothetical protein